MGFGDVQDEPGDQNVSCCTRYWVQFRRLQPLSKGFLACATFSCVLNVTLSILQLTVNVKVVGGTVTGTEYTTYWGVVEILTVLFFLYFAWDGIFTENMFEMHAFQLSSMLSAIYGVIQYSYLYGTPSITIYDHIQLGVQIVFQIAFSILGLMVHRSFGWWIFRKVGADVKLKELYRNYQIFVTQVKFDLQLGLLIVCISFFFVSWRQLAFGILEIFVFINTLAWAWIGMHGVRKESTMYMKAFSILAFIQPINIIIKAIYVMMNYKEFGPNAPFIQVGVVALLALVNRCTIFINGIRAWKGFGLGLKENAFDRNFTNYDMTKPFAELVPGKEILVDEEEDL